MGCQDETSRSILVMKRMKQDDVQQLVCTGKDQQLVLQR
jgi:hypothetical protein